MALPIPAADGGLLQLHSTRATEETEPKHILLAGVDMCTLTRDVQAQKLKQIETAVFTSQHPPACTQHSDEQPGWPDPAPPLLLVQFSLTDHTHCWHQTCSLSSSSPQKPLELPAVGTPTAVKQRARHTEGGQKSDLSTTGISCGDQTQLSQTSC